MHSGENEFLEFPLLHLKMNFYCSTNHKYGNSILDFALKLLKFPRNCAFNAYNVQPVRPPPTMSPSFCFFLPPPRRRRLKHDEEGNGDGKKNFEDLSSLKRIFGEAKSGLRALRK